MAEERRDDAAAAEPDTPEAPSAGSPSGRDSKGAAPDLELDLELERIDTEGVLKEGFSGQEM